MSDSRAAEVVRRFGQLSGSRGTWESHWEELAQLNQPFRDGFTSTQRTGGEKKGQQLYDGTAGYAANNLASGLWGMVTNPANKWFRVGHEDQELEKRQEVKLWLDDVTDKMLKALQRPEARFYSQTLTFLLDWSIFGTSVMFSDEELAQGHLWFSCRHLAECYIAQNYREQVDTCYRRFRMSVREAAQQFGPAALSDDMARALEKEPDRKFSFVHGVEPDPDHKPSAPLGPNGKPFRSLYVCLDSNKLMGAGGYHEFSYHVARAGMDSRDVYGNSPAMLARADAKMLQSMSKTTIVSAQKAVDPPLLAPDEFAVRSIRTTPGTILPGTLDPMTGRPLLQPLQTGGQIGLGLEMENQRREMVREAFFYSLMLMASTPGATATEILERQEEKLRLLGPLLGNLQSEFLGSAISRAFRLMYRAGAFMPPPRVLAQYPALRIEYIGPLARAQKVAEATNIMRAIQGAATVAAVDPKAMDVIDGDEAVRAILDGFGTPARIARDPEAVAARRQAAAEQQQQAQMVEAAPPLAKAARDIAQAGAA